MKIQVKGLNRWEAGITRKTATKKERMKEEVRKTSYKIERTAKQLAPVDTGYLRSNIKTSFEDGGFTGIVSSNAEYSVYVEFGTWKMVAQPYMTPAGFRHKQEFRKNVKRILKGD